MLLAETVVIGDEAEDGKSPWEDPWAKAGVIANVVGAVRTGIISAYAVALGVAITFQNRAIKERLLALLLDCDLKVGKPRTFWLSPEYPKVTEACKRCDRSRVGNMMGKYEIVKQALGLERRLGSVVEKHFNARRGHTCHN